MFANQGSKWQVKRILVVDDDEQILKILDAALRKRGYEPVIEAEPLAVVELLRDQPFDLVMLDINMPRKDGFEIYADIKQWRRELPVLFITGYTESFSMRSARVIRLWTHEFADGNTDVLYKPFKLDVLYEKIEGLIGSPAGEKTP